MVEESNQTEFLIQFDASSFDVSKRDPHKCTVKSRYLEVDGTIFYKFKLAEVQINLYFE